MLKLTRKLAINCFVYPVYSLFNEIKKFFLFFLKSGYKGYKC